MYEGTTVGVVVPAYNEEGFVGRVIDTVPTFVDRVYVVDDCSTDDTWAEIDEHAERANQVSEPALADGGVTFDRPVVPIRHEENRGVGGSIKTGYRAAMEDGIEVIAVMNGDGQMDPAMLDRIIDPVVSGKAAYAKGNRLLYREYRRGMSAWRFFGNSVLTVLTKIASGYWKMMDPQNGYTAVSADALREVGLVDIYEDYGFCNDVLVKLNAHNLPIADVAMPAVYGEETSSIKYSTFIPKVSSLLLRDFLWRLKVKYLVLDFHPLALCYLVGALGTVLGLVVGGATLMSRSATVALARALPTLLLSVGFLLAAMVMDVRENDDLVVQVYD
jgi:glycosyltransferase involved in cell wall biosynthesis